MRSKSLFVIAIFGFCLITCFQNCSGFEVIERNDVNSSLSDNNPQPTPTPTPNPTVAPSPSPSPSPTVTPAPSAQLEKTVFYLGRSAAIDAVELDHASGVFRQVSGVSFAGSGVGWMAYDKTSATVLAADAGNAGKLEIYDSQSNGVLSSRGIVNYLNGIVHLTAVPGSAGYSLFASNYGAGTLSYHRFTGTAAQAVQTVSFGASAKAHSSAFVPSKNLLFVATLGLNKLSVFKVSNTGLTAAGDISLQSPRTVVYDAIYDKVYVSTEVSNGSSYIKGYSISEPTPGNFTFTEVASLAMSEIAADLKVNHAHGYVMANSREIGKQAINGMPVTASGALDSSRTSFLIPLTQVQPRSLEITEDGQYALVAMNSSSAANVVAFKLTFDSRHQFVRSEKVFEQKVANEGYVSALSIPFYSK